jgi:hypothetical protein
MRIFIKLSLPQYSFVWDIEKYDWGARFIGYVNKVINNEVNFVCRWKANPFKTFYWMDLLQTHILR